MCGIAGVYSTVLSSDTKHALTAEMIALMAHRGPDGSELYTDDLIAIGMTRLAIVDPHAASVLNWDETGRRVIAMNGEVYNHKHLRDSLPKHLFRTHTDTEVVLHLYEEKGRNGLDLLSGDYAIAIWDRAERQGVLARDPVGVKPLYIADIAGGIAFASEINALTAVFPELKRVDPLAISDYLMHGYVPGPETIFAGVRKLAPGSRLFFGARSETVRRPVPPPIDYLSGGETLVEAEKRLIESIKTRIPEEVPYGVLLSGGLDSSLVTAIAARQSSQAIKTYSIAFTNPGDSATSEHSNSRAVSTLFGTDHHELDVDMSLFRDAVEESTRHLGEPIAEPPAVLLGLLCRMARRDLPVLLSGEGADELFAGYWLYDHLLDSGARYTGMGNRFTRNQQKSILSRDMLSQLEGHKSLPEIFSEAAATPRGRADRVNQMLETDKRYWLVDDLLVKADHMGMMASTEIRVPYLDESVVQLAAGLPLELRLQGGAGKIALRRIAESYLPSAIISQQKRGFSMPLGAWLRGPMRLWAEDLLASLGEREYFDRAAIAGLREEYFRETSRSLPDRLARRLRNRFSPGMIVIPDQVVWTLVALELFFRRL